jgi:hypothetical protein
MVKTLALVGGVAFAALMASTAPAQAQTAPTCNGTTPPPSQTVNGGNCGPVVVSGDQVQTGGVVATVTINGQSITVTPAPTDGSPAEITATSVTGLSTALGNNLTASSIGNVGIIGSATQTLTADVRATGDIVTLSAVPGVTLQATSAFGNTAQAQACCGGIDLAFTQSASGGVVEAIGRVTTAPCLGTLSMSSAATANVVGGSVTNGPTTLSSTQSNASTVNSWAFGSACCNNQSITLGSTAAANSSAASSETSTVYHSVTQTNTGYISSNSDHVTNSGTLVTTATQATGNSANAFNKWGYTDLRGTQSNDATVRAQSSLVANNYLLAANSGSTAQGNSAVLSSSGSDGTISLDQFNGGAGSILADTIFTASSASGGVGSATTTAAGNSLTAYACGACGTAEVKIEGYTTQVNGGSVTSSTTIGGASGSALVGRATAVGNTANFLVSPGGGQ